MVTATKPIVSALESPVKLQKPASSLYLPHDFDHKTDLFMIGHSNHRLSELLSLIEKYNIQTLWDVRSYPSSRFPWFVYSNLRESCEKQEIKYYSVKRLGGKNPLPVTKLRELLDYFLPPTNPSCMMCSEGKHVECHRHYLLTPIILKMGYRVFQIQRDGSLIEDKGPDQKTLQKNAQYLPYDVRVTAPRPEPSQSGLF